MSQKIQTKEYLRFLQEAKQRISSARIRASKAVDHELIQLYWDIGRMIVERQERLGWGKAIVEKFSRDLREIFPGNHGFSPQNLWYMRQFYLEYRSHSNLQQLAGEIPWFSNVLIMSKVKESKAREFYLKATAKLGWSRNVLLNQIKAQAFEYSKKEGKTHNFKLALPEELADQAEEALKSSYNLEFLNLQEAVAERELERQLIERLKNFILELGYGFCFIGNQYRITLGKNEYFLDLLFYHRFLKSLVAIELKTGKFKPEYAGKMDFYLNVLNEKERAPDDNPSIGIILCAERDQVEVEFSLKTKANPIGVAHYKLYKNLPKELKGKLPTVQELAEGWQFSSRVKK